MVPDSSDLPTMSPVTLDDVEIVPLNSVTPIISPDTVELVLIVPAKSCCVPIMAAVTVELVLTVTDNSVAPIISPDTVEDVVMVPEIGSLLGWSIKSPATVLNVVIVPSIQSRSITPLLKLSIAASTMRVNSTACAVVQPEAEPINVCCLVLWLLAVPPLLNASAYQSPVSKPRDPLAEVVNEAPL